MAQAASAESPSGTPRLAGVKRYMTPKECADYRSMGYSSLNIERMKGEGPPFIKWGPNVRYDREVVDRWMAEHTVTPAPKVAAARRVGRPRKEGK
jgi:hypothetical protein